MMILAVIFCLTLAKAQILSCREYSTALEPNQENDLTVALNKMTLCFMRANRTYGRRPSTYHINLENFYKTPGGYNQQVKLAQNKRMTHNDTTSHQNLSRLVKLQNLMVLIASIQPKINAIDDMYNIVN